MTKTPHNIDALIESGRYALVIPALTERVKKGEGVSYNVLPNADYVVADDLSIPIQISINAPAHLKGEYDAVLRLLKAEERPQARGNRAARRRAMRGRK
jgi:hypothetical protein